MENKNKYISAFLALSLGLTSCAKKVEKPIFASNTAIISPPTLTFTPTQIETPVPTVERVLTLDEKFNLGPLNLATVPMDIQPSVELMKAMNFQNTDQVFHAKVPMAVKVDYFPTDTDGDVGTKFHDNASRGGVMVFLTDRDNIKVYDAHSEGFEAPGEPARFIGSFIMKHPEMMDLILGKELTLTPVGADPITASIAYVNTVSSAFFNNAHGLDRIWSVNEQGDNVIFLRTDLAGIPNEIRNDKTPGVYFIIYVACTPQDGDPINLNIFDKNRSAFNEANRSIVVLKIVTK